MKDNSKKRIPVDGNAINQTAIKLYKQIQELEPGTSSQPSRRYEFSASTGWRTGFTKIHALPNIKIKGEIASADETAARESPQKLAKIIKDGSCSPDQAWNADETGLF